MQTLGERLRQARRAAGLTQAELARLVGVQRAVISKYETGGVAPSVTQLRRMAEALGVSAGTLLPEPEGRDRARLLELVGETGLPHGPEGGATVAEVRQTLDRVTALFGARAAQLLRLTAVMDEAGQQQVLDRARELLPLHIGGMD